MLYCRCIDPCHFLHQGPVNTEHSGECVDQRGHPVCCNGARSLKRCHKVTHYTPVCSFSNTYYQALSFLLISKGIFMGFQTRPASEIHQQHCVLLDVNICNYKQNTVLNPLNMALACYLKFWKLMATMTYQCFIQHEYAIACFVDLLNVVL